MQFNILLALFIVCCYNSATGQQLFMQRYPTETHKAAYQNWDVEQDLQGNMYFANSYGVLIFDGISWELLNLPDNAYCWSLAIDKKGVIYVGAEHEFGYLQKTLDGKFKYVSLTELLPEKKRSDIKSIVDIGVQGQSVFFSDQLHCYIYHDGRIDILDAPNIYFIPLDDSLYWVDAKTYTVYLYKNDTLSNVNLNLEANDIGPMDSYKEKYFLILDQANRVLLIDPSNGKKQVLSEGINTTLKGLPITRICMLTDNRLALLTDREIMIIDLNGKILGRVTSAMLGESNLWSTIFYEDARHNLWFSTDEFIGLTITSSPLAYYDKANGFKGVVFALGGQGDERYVGTDIGLYHQKQNDQFKLVPGTDGLIWNIYTLKDRSYLAHSDGVFEVVHQQATKLTTHSSVLSLCILKQSQGSIIMGTADEGIWLLTKGKASWRKHKINGFEEETRYIQEDRAGNLWISHDGKGIWKLRLNEKMDSVIEKKFYTTSSGLPSNLYNRVFKLRDQKIIAGTTDGIYCYNDANDIFEPDNRFTKALHGNTIVSLAESQEGQLYLRAWESMDEAGSFSGILVRAADSTYALLRTLFDKITWIDTGVPLTATSSGAWFGNNNKVVSYNPNQQTFYQEPLQPVIKKVIAADSTICFDCRTDGAMDIPYSKNSLMFYFNVIFNEDVEKNEFQYKLIGLNKEWSAWTDANEAHFTNLPEGDYTFQVRAKNVYNSESNIASYTFRINRPIYRTVWAYMVYSLVLALTMYWLTVLRTKRVNMQKRILEHKVHEKTKELVAMNEEILLQSEALEQQAEILKASNYTKDKLFSIISHDLRGPIRQFGEVFNMIERGYISAEEFQYKLMPDLKERANYVSTLTDNLLQWAKGQMGGIQVNKSELNVADIIHENSSLLSPQALKKSITLKAEITEGLQNVYADQDMIKLIVRNLVSNAIKFTPEFGVVEVSTKTDHDSIFISVQDNGTGLSPEDINKIVEKEYFTKYGTSGEKGSGLGLMLCREFIEKNGGVLTIESQPGIGSTFTFHLPIYKQAVQTT
ncbi:sensor histidine kinase [Ohtaekwangia koreensis]|uniref:histidine kinase n=1 Tax=Ohtaekwangia koreensis TaxID=688867 RepID=A0A1T5M032_9BACT|nr:ATP-binding protein [Ohtaekwangia koreensis]SKC81621.1 Signal transduction histidine kinase [Ohtaekwangia koreensis]